MTAFPFATVGFDLDGTLFDTHEDLAAALNHVLGLEGRGALPPAHVRKLVGGGARRLLAKGLEAAGGRVSDARFEELFAELLAYYEAHIAVHTRLFPGAEAMLDELAARGVGIALVTNKLERLARLIVERLGLADRFACVIGGDTLGEGSAKPAPDMVLAMIERCGPGPAAYVGDSSFDTRAAAAAGVPAILVSFGFADAPPASLGASVVIDHFDELVPALQRIACASSPPRPPVAPDG